jgi:hypothetical protein
MLKGQQEKEEQRLRDPQPSIRENKSESMRDNR